MGTREFNECQPGFTTTSGCGLLKIGFITWVFRFSRVGENIVRATLKNRPTVRALCRTPAHSFSPNIEEVREVDNAL